MANGMSASTGLIISSLVRPEYLVEVEAIAAKAAAPAAKAAVPAAKGAVPAAKVAKRPARKAAKRKKRG